MEITNKREKSPDILRLIEKRKVFTKTGNIRLEFDSSLNRKLWAPRRPDKGGRENVAEIDLELSFPEQ